MADTTPSKQLTACLRDVRSNRDYDPSYEGSDTKISVSRPTNRHPYSRDLEISFQRTVRVADNNKVNNLPPSLGKFPIYDTADFKQTLPPHMIAKGGYFIPMYRE